MSLLRWSDGPWYVFFTVKDDQDLLAVWHDVYHDDYYLTYDTVCDFLSGRKDMDDIPGWKECTETSRREELVIALFIWAHRCNQQYPL